MSKLTPELKTEWVARLRATPDGERANATFHALREGTPCFCALGHLLDAIGMNWEDRDAQHHGWEKLDDYLSYEDQVRIYTMSDKNLPNDQIANYIEINL